MSKTLHNCMTKADLLELLECVPEDGIIAFPQPTHNHWHQVIAKTLNNQSASIEEVEVSWSDYNEDFIVDEGEDDDESVGYETKKQIVYLLS